MNDLTNTEIIRLAKKALKVSLGQDDWVTISGHHDYEPVMIRNSVALRYNRKDGLWSARILDSDLPAEYRRQADVAYIALRQKVERLSTTLVRM